MTERQELIARRRRCVVMCFATIPFMTIAFIGDEAVTHRTRMKQIYVFALGLYGLCYGLYEIVRTTILIRRCEVSFADYDEETDDELRRARVASIVHLFCVPLVVVIAVWDRRFPLLRYASLAVAACVFLLSVRGIVRATLRLRRCGTI
jgi:hypothetical protein